MTTPRPRRRFEGAAAGSAADVALGVPTVVEEEESAAWPCAPAVEAGVPADGLRGGGGMAEGVAVVGVGVELEAEFGCEVVSAELWLREDGDCMCCCCVGGDRCCLSSWWWW